MNKHRKHEAHGLRSVGLGWKRFFTDETGSDTIEFALSSVLILSVLFGIMDCSRAVYIDHYLAQAARDGSRYAMVRGASWTSSCSGTNTASCTASSSNVSSYVNSTVTTGIVPANMTVTTHWPGTTANGGSCSSSSISNSQGCLVNVQVSYAFQFSLPLMPTSGLTMSSSSSATILQ